MATVQKRGSYQWRVQIRKKGHPPQTRTFDARSEADAWARQVEGEMDRGLFVSRKEAENTTLTEALDRYERGSLLITSNLEFSRWSEVFGDPSLTTALLDRLTHHSHVLVFQGESYRFRESHNKLRKKMSKTT